MLPNRDYAMVSVARPALYLPSPVNLSGAYRRRGEDVLRHLCAIRAGSPRPRLARGPRVIAVYENLQSSKLSYLMWLEWKDGRVSFIRDYRYVRYVVDNAELVLASSHHK